MKRVSIYLIVGLISIISIFSIININSINSVSADEVGQTYSYTADIVTDYDTSFLNGIDSVSFNFGTYYRYVYFEPININFYQQSLVDMNYPDNCCYIGFKVGDDENQVVDYTANCFTSSLYFFGDFNTTRSIVSDYVDGVYYDNIYRYKIIGWFQMIIISDGFICEPGSNYSTNYEGVSFEHNWVDFRNYYTNDSNLSSYLDMNSSTNFSYNINDVLLGDTLSSSTSVTEFNNLSWFLTDIAVGSRYGYSFTHMYFGNVMNCNSKSSFFWIQQDGSNYTPYFNYVQNGFMEMWCTNYDCKIRENRPVKYAFSSKIYVKDFEIKVNRPVNRTENTLVLYNYDYDCAISSISSVEYALSKDSNIYKANYTGTLPNSRIIGFVCDELQNRLYDEYIYIYITFVNNSVDFSNLEDFSLGFDFNFSRFYEPLVIEDNIFFQDINFPGLNKPEHWYQFAGWIMYGVTYILFYNPIIEPVTRFLFPFISILINVCKFLLNLPLGQFILAYIGFMVITKFIGSFMPNGGIGGVVVNSTTNLVQTQSKENRLNRFAKKQKYNELNKKYISDKVATKELKRMSKYRKRQCKNK